MDTFQRVESIDETVDGLIGEVDDFDEANAAQFGHVVGDFGDRKIGQVGATCDVDVAKTRAGASQMRDGTIGDVGNVTEMKVCRFLPSLAML